MSVNGNVPVATVENWTVARCDVSGWAIEEILVEACICDTEKEFIAKINSSELAQKTGLKCSGACHRFANGLPLKEETVH